MTNNMNANRNKSYPGKQSACGEYIYISTSFPWKHNGQRCLG